MLRFHFPRPLRAPEGDGSGGADPAAAAAAGDKGGAGGVPGLLDELGDDAGEAGADTQAGGDGGEGGKTKRPDTIPEQFWDAEKGALRGDDLVKSWRDLRAQISRGEHKPPPKPEAYAVPKVEGLPEGLIGGEGDKLWPEIRNAAHAAGVSQKQLEAIAGPMLKELVATLPAPEDPEARKVQADAEFAKLGPNGRQVAKDTLGWLNGMAARGEFTEAEVQALKRVGTAEGIRALAKLRAFRGEKPIPTEALADGQMSVADANRMMQEGVATGDQAKIDRARRELEKMDKAGLLGGT
jgi:hypothetical protein